MRVAVLGTGMVGRAISAASVRAGQSVRMGTRDVQSSLERSEGPMGGALPTLAQWQSQNPDVSLTTFDEAVADSDLVFNATSGAAALAVLEGAGPEALAGKVLVDISNPLDFSGGMPPSLSICNTDSLAEQIQRAFPDTRVVKSLNTTNASIMVSPKDLANGEHTMFVAGNEEAAKATVKEALTEWFGWTDIIDLGDLKAARGMEMALPLWLSLYGALGTANFNFKIVR